MQTNPDPKFFIKMSPSEWENKIDEIIKIHSDAEDICKDIYQKFRITNYPTNDSEIDKTKIMNRYNIFVKKIQIRLNNMKNDRYFRKCKVVQKYECNDDIYQLIINAVEYLIRLLHGDPISSRTKERLEDKKEIQPIKKTISSKRSDGKIICYICYTENDLSRTECIGCDESMVNLIKEEEANDRQKETKILKHPNIIKSEKPDESSWTCSHCNFINIENEICSICLQNKDDKVSPKVKEPVTTSVNNNEIKTKSIQNKLASVPVTGTCKISVDEMINGWKCAHCTCKNEYNQSNCGACLRSRLDEEENLGFNNAELSDRNNGQNKNDEDNDSKIDRIGGGKNKSRIINKVNKKDNKSELAESNYQDHDSTNISDSISKCFDQDKSSESREMKCNSQNTKNLQNESMKEEIQIVEEWPKEKWICGGCKYQNEYDKLACIKCEKVALFFDKWRCETCTCINEKLERNCIACGNRNENIVDCRSCHVNKVNKLCDEICDECLQRINEEDECKRRSSTELGNRSLQKDRTVKVQNTEGQNNNNKINKCGTCKSSNKDQILEDKGVCEISNKGRRCGGDNNDDIPDEEDKKCEIPRSKCVKCCKIVTDNGRCCNECNKADKVDIDDGSKLFNNKDNKSTNLIDDNDNSSIRNVDEIPEDKWICKGCKYQNEYHKFACIKCDKVAPFFDKWRCEACTCINEKLGRICIACESRNENLVACRICHGNKVNKLCDEICDECLRNIDEMKRRDSFGLDCKVESGNLDLANKTKEKDKNKSNICESCNKNKCFDETETCGPCYINRRSSSNKDSPVQMSLKSGMLTSKCKKCYKNQPPKKVLYCVPCCWFCTKPKCNTINDPGKDYCKSCGMKQGEIIKEGNTVDVMTKSGVIKMWCCTKCQTFTAGKPKCSSCGNLRYMPGYKKCGNCQWVNLPVDTKCKGCDGPL